MAEFKLDFSKFSKEKLIEIKTNAEKTKELNTDEENIFEFSDVNIENIFSTSEKISTNDMILSLSGQTDINNISQESLSEYNLFANLMANGDDEITKDEALYFAALSGDSKTISTEDMQAIINDIDDIDALLLEVNTSINQNILTNNKMNVINSGAQYDTTTGTYSVKVESYQNSKVNDGQGGKRYCNGSLWGITENVYGANADKEKIYQYIQEMNPQIKDLNLINKGDTIKLPILKYDNDNNIIGYEETDIPTSPTVPDKDTTPTTPTILEDTTPTIPDPQETMGPTLPPDYPTSEDEPTITIPSDITPTGPEPQETMGPPLPPDNPTVEEEPTTPPEREDGILMGGNISGDKYQGKFLSKYEAFFESNLASFNNKFNANGELDKAAYQGNTGDCVLISGCYAFASTEKGYEIIKDMITVNKNADGKIESYTVNFKGIGEEYTITEKELKSKTRPKLGRLFGNFASFAGGDEDMVLLELAYKKCAKETKSDKVNFDLGDKMLFGVNPKNLYTMIAGESCNYSTPETFIKDLEEGNLSENTVAQIGFNSSIKVKDVNGKRIKLQGIHAYSINEVTKDTVTLLNPWNTGEELVISRETFESLNPEKCDIYYLDLDKTNKEE